jgi:tetratricopeptide (TPR) repeat protein
METLKIFMLTFLIFSGTINALQGQNEKKLQEAFASSYKHETDGDYSKAIDVLRKTYDEQSYELNLRLGWLSYLNGSFTESTAYYNKAIQLMPFSIEARLGFALPASAQGNWDHVVTKYNEILKIDPNHYVTNYRMGLIYYYREDYAMAFKYFERIANMFPFDYDAIHMYAWVHLKQGKKKEAQVLFNKTLLIRPNDASALEGLSLSN